MDGTKRRVTLMGLVWIYGGLNHRNVLGLQPCGLVDKETDEKVMTPKPFKDKPAGKVKQRTPSMATYRMVVRVSEEKSKKVGLGLVIKEQIRWENGFCAGALWMWRRLKKPKLSEIRAREQRVPWTVEAIADFIDHARTDIPHLLDLVKRMGESLRRCEDAIETAIYNDDGLDGARGQRVIKEARELLKEIEK